MRAFALVARHRSFVQAAEELHLSPSAVSLQIKELEHAAGMPLFGRHGKTVSMTQAGELLLADVQLALQALKHADEGLGRLRQTTAGRVTVGMVSSARNFLPRLLAQFREQHRDAELHLVVGNRDKLIDQLRCGQVDLAIMGSPPMGFACHAEAFAALPLGIVAAPEHPLACKRNVPPPALAEHDIIFRESGSGTRAALERFICDHQLVLPRHREMNCNDAIKQAVMANLGLAFLSLHAATLEIQGGLLVTVDVIGLPLVRRWFVIDVDASTAGSKAWELRRFILERGASAGLPTGDLLPEGAGAFH